MAGLATGQNLSRANGGLERSAQVNKQRYQAALENQRLLGVD